MNASTNDIVLWDYKNKIEWKIWKKNISQQCNDCSNEVPNKGSKSAELRWKTSYCSAGTLLADTQGLAGPRLDPQNPSEGPCSQKGSLMGLGLLDLWAWLTSLLPVHLCQDCKAPVPTAPCTLPVLSKCLENGYVDDCKMVSESMIQYRRNTVLSWPVLKSPASSEHKAILLDKATSSIAFLE